MEQTEEVQEMNDDLVKRLRGEYRIPITDGFGAVGAGNEPENPNEFVRSFDTAPIQHEAADRIEELETAFKIFIEEIEDVFACISDATSASGRNYPPAFQTARKKLENKS